MDGTTNILELKGIGEKTAAAFGKMGIRDVDSLITMYPKYYLTYEDPMDLCELEVGQRASILVKICSEVHIQYIRRLKVVSCLAKDGTGTIRLTWFNMPYLKKHLNNFGITDYFQFVLSGTDFEKSKPDPEIYNVAAAKLGINKENLIIIEDSFAGLTAGNAAGIKTIGLKLSEVKQNTSIAHQQVNSFEEIEI